ncbi:MAG: GNAT family N-acetyltransferase [Chloroflexi bacterium]|nr:GNAT family N-acetyltransferase [Chloroflexota bacterium]
MPQQTVVLKSVSREDVSRIRSWLEDDEVSENWFGRYSYGDPAHLGYHPTEMENVSDEEWQRVFSDPEHRILSIYTEAGEHIGEVHLAIEESLGDGQVSLLIGRKDQWHKGFGTSAMIAALNLAFNEFKLYRVWADIPEYNTAALQMFRHLGFVHEGTLRKSRPHEGSRFDSVVMGILQAEYVPHDDSENSETHTETHRV